MYIKNVHYQSNLYIFIFSAMLSWTTHLKPDSELPKELLSVDALLNIVNVSIKVLDENVNLTRIKKYFSKEACNHLKDIISTKKKTRFMTVACAKLICILKIVLRAMSLN